MATIVAVLHHKMKHFFWTGFYRIDERGLIAGPYQGPVACAVLPKGQGVCWACVDRGEPVVVANVHEFDGHIACDARSQSEVVVPVRNADGTIIAVLDVDSDKLNAFNEVDADGLSRIVELVAARDN